MERMKGERYPLVRVAIGKLIVIFAIGMLGSCCTLLTEDDCGRCVPPGDGGTFTGMYEFVVPAKLYPARDTYHIGDTIWIESVFTDSIYERTTGRRFKIGDATIMAKSYIERLNVDRLSKAEDGYLDFEVLVPEEYRFGGSIYELYSVYEEGDTVLSVEYEGIYNYEEGVYSMKFQLVPRDTGRYIFLFFAVVKGECHPRLSRLSVEFEGKCPMTGVCFFTHVNEGDDNNIYLLKESPIEFFNTDVYQRRPQENFYDRGGYCFVVVE